MKKLCTRIAALFLLAAVFAGIFPANAVAAQNSKPYLIKVNKKMCTVTIYEQDKKGKYTVPVKAMLCSTGAETPLGTFKTPSKYRWRLLVGDVWGQYSTRIVNGVLFHSVWYYSKNEATLSNRQFNNLGKMVSHGCVRLNVEDAKWIYDNCPLGTTVVVYNSDNPGPLGKPEGIKVSEKTKMGYDPTDIWAEGNPYVKKTPKITGAKNRTIDYGTEVSVKDKVKATSITGQDISSSIKTQITFQGKAVKKIDTKITGKYKVTYKITDIGKKKAEKTVTFTVVDNVKPVLKTLGDLYWSEDKKITRKDVLEGVELTWHGDSYNSDNVTYETTVEEEKEGLKVYLISYSYKAPNGKTGTATRRIYVDTQAPVMDGVTDGEYTVESPDGLSGELDISLLTEQLKVSDNVSELTNKDIAVSLELIGGEYYKAVYSIKDQAGNETTKEARIRIIQKQAVLLEEETDTPSTENGTSEI
ncbi:L,D-transpeptidase [Acetivibrio ethanolgignens]|uniref:L,D-TPase catalytic domain-containing protein n=1 Tax=Acetivibrio ethanolgignens TaxID=290052 RepID=A0A0V8QE44_9FIRM|nr:L,D-transpeptidase [Acetivibrio ethanolgignens]KSV58877.1 hypothetical protein ASU35_11300 [Acetivibrio ethanolgignens]